MEKLDLPTIRLHDLRHTHATLALTAGVHPKVVSERLGHATVSITLDLYSHVVPSLAQDAAGQIMQATYGDREPGPLPRSVGPLGPPTRRQPSMTGAPDSNATDETGSDWGTVLTRLRSDGFSRAESIRITKAVLHCPLLEAETIVHESSAWAEMRDEDAPKPFFLPGGVSRDDFVEMIQHLQRLTLHTDTAARQRADLDEFVDPGPW